MGLLLIAIIATCVISVALLHYGADCYDGLHFISFLSGFLLACATGVAAVFYAVAGWSWIAADSKARIINREYGTNYTREEIFYASDVIDTIREIDRKRVEVNGDLMQERGAE